MLCINLLEALLLTEAVETITALLLGYRGKKFFKVLILINIITNPALNIILNIMYNIGIYNYAVLTLLEVMVVFGEWRLFKFALGSSKKSFLSLSIIINLSSYIAGVLLF